MRYHREDQGRGEAQDAITGAHRAVEAEREGQSEPTPEERRRQRSLPRVRVEAHHQRWNVKDSSLPLRLPCIRVLRKFSFSHDKYFCAFILSLSAYQYNLAQVNI